MSDNHIPPEIYQIARIHHLGTPLGRYETLPIIHRHYHFSLSTVITVIWLGLFAFATTVAIFSQPSLPLPPSPEWGIPLLWPICWIVVFWLLIASDIRTTSQQTALYACELGLIGSKAKDMSIIPWDNIKSVGLQIVPFYTEAREEGKREYNWIYTFHCSDGKKHTFRGSSDITALSHLVDQEITRRFLPAAIAAYEAGKSVIFGTIQISRKGIQVGRDAFAWQNILSLDMEGDNIIIRLPDWEHYVIVKKTNIPNVCVLKALVQHIVSEEKRSIAIQTQPQVIYSPRYALRHRKMYRRQKSDGDAGEKSE